MGIGNGAFAGLWIGRQSRAQGVLQVPMVLTGQVCVQWDSAAVEPKEWAATA